MSLVNVAYFPFFLYAHAPCCAHTHTHSFKMTHLKTGAVRTAAYLYIAKGTGGVSRPLKGGQVLPGPAADSDRKCIQIPADGILSG